MTATDSTTARSGRMRVARSRGAVSGFLLVLLGLWGALIPFVGPYFDLAYTPDAPWTWTWGRFWLEVLPGVAAILGGLMLALTSNRAIGVLGGWLASAAGAWFVVGPLVSQVWDGPASVGDPVGSTGRQVLEQLAFFTGLGALILFLGAQALGRFTVLGVRDVRAAERRREERERERTVEFEGNRAGDGRLHDEPVHDTRSMPVVPPPPGTTSADGSTRVETARRP